MPAQVAEYKGRRISVSVYGPHGGGAYTGSFVITETKRDEGVDYLYTPIWDASAHSEGDALGVLLKVARAVIDGTSDGTRTGNG